MTTRLLDSHQSLILVPDMLHYRPYFQSRPYLDDKSDIYGLLAKSTSLYILLHSRIQLIVCQLLLSSITSSLQCSLAVPSFPCTTLPDRKFRWMIRVCDVIAFKRVLSPFFSCTIYGCSPKTFLANKSGNQHSRKPDPLN